jgi:hypothetical protein
MGNCELEPYGSEHEPAGDPYEPYKQPPGSINHANSVTEDYQLLKNGLAHVAGQLAELHYEVAGLNADIFLKPRQPPVVVSPLESSGQQTNWS